MIQEIAVFELEIQLLDNAVITEKQQEWKRKFVSMDLTRLIRKALDKLKIQEPDYWIHYKCIQRPYGLTITSVDERYHLTLHPLSTTPCNSNCILFHQPKGRFREWFTIDVLAVLAGAIQFEIEYFLHKKIPTTLKYPITSFQKNRGNLMSMSLSSPITSVILQEQEEEDEPDLPNVIGKMELDIEDETEDMDMV
jgi:hypothetical protein